MTEGIVRRKKILDILKKSGQPVSGSRLSSETGVSRQVIVQDIALLRAGNEKIYATPKGYVLSSESGSKRVRRLFMVRHTRDEIKDELTTIIENGGKVLNIIIPHDVYGQLTADLIIESAEDIETFYSRLINSRSGPLLQISDGIHIHTVEAASNRILQNIERDLREKGYLVQD